MKESVRDEGSIVLGWLVKIVLVLSIIGVAGFDAVSVASAHVSTSDDADSAAAAAADEYQSTHNAKLAYAAASDEITNPSEQVVSGSLSIAADGTATLTIERKVTTLAMHDIGPLKKYTVLTVTGEGAPQSP